MAALGPRTLSISATESPASEIRCCGERNGDRWPLRLGAFFRRARLPSQISADDQTDVTIGLRKIAQHAAVSASNSSASKPTSLQRECKRPNNFQASAWRRVTCQL